MRRRFAFISLTLGLALSLILVGSNLALATHPPVTQNAPSQDDVRPYLGVRVQETDNGVTVAEVVPGSPAEEAGIQAKDVIRTYNGEEITSAQQLIELVGAGAVGDAVSLEVERAGEIVEIAATLGEWAVTPSEIFIAPPQSGGRGGRGPMMGGRIDAFGPMMNNFHWGHQWVQLGVQYRSLTPEIAEAEALSVAEGALVEEVLADTPAEDAGLQVGDIITAVDGDIVDIEHTLSDRLYAYEPEDRVTLTVLRGEETLEIGVVLAEGQHPFMPYLGDVVEGFIPFEMPGMPGRDIIFEGIPFNSDNFPSPRIRIFSEAFPGGDSIMPFSGQIQISTEPPAEIVEGMVVYECTRGNQVWYLSIAGEMKKMMENRPNMPMMGNCEIYASGDSSSTENNLNS